MLENHAERAKREYLEVLDRDLIKFENKDQEKSDLLKRDIYKRYPYLLESIDMDIRANISRGLSAVSIDLSDKGYGSGFINPIVEIYESKGFVVDVEWSGRGEGKVIIISWDKWNMRI